MKSVQGFSRKSEQIDSYFRSFNGSVERGFHHERVFFKTYKLAPLSLKRGEKSKGDNVVVTLKL